MSKKTLLTLIVTLFLLFSCIIVIGQEEELCQASGGQWITPNTKSDDPIGLGNTPQPFCQCNLGFKIVENSCVEMPKQELCQGSGGKWQGNICNCPQNSIGWKEGFGCDYKNIDIQYKNITGGSYQNNIGSVRFNNPAIYIIILLLIIIIGLYWFLKKWRSKRK